MLTKHRLTVAAIERAKPKKPGTVRRIADGGGLYLLVRQDRKDRAVRKFWQFRFAKTESKTKRVKTYSMGLGPADGFRAIPVVEARELAAKYFKALQDGINPLERKRAEAKQAEAAVPFKTLAETYIDQCEAAKFWKSEKHAAQWRSTLATYAYPVIGDTRCDQISTEDVLKILRPIWNDKRETASRVRSRVELVLDHAKAKSLLTGINPAAWSQVKPHLSIKGSKAKKVEHLAALDHDNLPALMGELAGTNGIAALALRFCILTATRTTEVINAKWGEIDQGRAVWSIPAERMKMGRPHKVPLSKQALSILAAMKPHRRDGDYIFPGAIAESGLSNMAMLKLLKSRRPGVTVHGTARAGFRSWCADQGIAHELAEMSLAHVEGAIVKAYQRSDMLKARAKIMQDWGDYCEPGIAAPGNVVEMKRESA